MDLYDQDMGHAESKVSNHLVSNLAMTHHMSLTKLWASMSHKGRLIFHFKTEDPSQEGQEVHT